METLLVYLAMAVATAVAFHLIRRPSRKERRFAEIEARLNWQRN